jgi:hypothetical protein
MSMYDEELRSLSHRTKGHIEVWEHLGMGRLNCSVVDLCYRRLIKRVLETSRGCP